MIKICGIVGVITKKGKSQKHKLSEIFQYAVTNKHRGEDDGFGIMDIENEKIRKSTFTFDEINDEELSDDRKKELKKKKEIKQTESKLKELKKYMDGVESKALLIHHRKSSFGSVRLCNTHPFRISKQTYYMHNGSIDGIYPLRNYLEYIGGCKFKSYTDSEVISTVFEGFWKSKDKEFKSYKSKLDMLSKIFWGFGVIIRVDTKKKGITIISDGARSLYLYDYKDFFLLISEPISSLNGFNQCLKLEEGIFSLNENGFKKRNGKVMIITKELNEFLDSGRQESHAIKCEFCDDFKYTQRFFSFDIRTNK